MSKIALTLGLVLSLAGSAFASPTHGSFMKADGMTGHLTRELAKPGSGPHHKDPVVKSAAFGNAGDRHRPFLAYTTKHMPAKGDRPAQVRYQYIHGHVDMETGALSVHKVERGHR